MPDFNSSVFVKTCSYTVHVGLTTRFFYKESITASNSKMIANTFSGVHKTVKTIG